MPICQLFQMSSPPRQPRGRQLAVLAATLGLLAGCGTSGSTTNPATSTTVPSTTAPSTTVPSTTAPSTTTPLVTSTTKGSQTCSEMAHANRYIEIQSVAAATGNDPNLSITYQAATLVCGGADDSHYDTGGPSIKADVASSTPVGIFEFGSTGGPVEHQTTASQLPGTFSHLLFGHIFLVEADANGTIVGLQQQYHP
jgi:hypothetical protein